MRNLLAPLIILFSLALAGCAAPAVPPPTPTLSPELARGWRVFQAECGACHSLQPDMTIVGPSLAGIARTGAGRVDGQDSRTYIYTAILNPNAYIVPGFSETMPTTFGKSLSGEDLDALVAFLLTQE